jgi:competence protein ComEC
MRKYFVFIVILCAILLFTNCNSQTTTTQSSQTVTTPTNQVTTSTTETSSEPLGELNVHFIDVGQGDSILIDYGDIEILIDGGDRSPGVVTYLSSYVDGAIEVMVATHPHADHIGGLIAVLEHFEVEEIWHNGDLSTSKTYEDFMNAVQSENAEVHIARLHDVIHAGTLSFKVHNPANLQGTTNNNSIVLHLAYGQIDFLFTGDAEQEAERDMMMLDSLPVPEVEILKVGHHGSRTASSEDFLSITSPEVAIYMAGEGNSYGHPHEETIAALNNIGAVIYGTDVNGTIVVTTDGETYLIQTER